jgi:hypothetical protein
MGLGVLELGKCVESYGERVGYRRVLSLVKR